MNIMYQERIEIFIWIVTIIFFVGTVYQFSSADIQASLCLALAVPTTLLAAILTTYSRISSARIQASERRLACALEGAQDGLWDWDISTGRTYYSKQQEALLGIKVGELRQHFWSWLELVHPDDRLRFVEASTTMTREPEGRCVVEFRCWHTEGRWIWVIARGKVVERDAGGRALRAVGTMTDITERMRKLEDLVRTKRLMEEVIAGMNDDFDLFDCEERLVFTNDRDVFRHEGSSAMNRLGKTFATLLRNSIEAGLVRGVGRNEADAFIITNLESFRRGQNCGEIELADGRWIEVIVEPTSDDGRLVIRRDISEHKLAAAAVAKIATNDALTCPSAIAHSDGSICR